MLKGLGVSCGSKSGRPFLEGPLWRDKRLPILKRYQREGPSLFQGGVGVQAPDAGGWLQLCFPSSYGLCPRPPPPAALCLKKYVSPF